MTLRLFGHPFSSYTWKALIPLYENGTAFTFRNPGGRRGQCRARGPLAAQALSGPGRRRSHGDRGDGDHRISPRPSPRPGADDPPRSRYRGAGTDARSSLRQLCDGHDAEARARRAAAPGTRATPSASTRRWPGSTRGLCPARCSIWPGASGRRETVSPSPIAPPRPRSSTPIGCAPIPEALGNLRAYRARLLARAPRSRAASRKPGPIGHISRWVHPSGIERPH